MTGPMDHFGGVRLRSRGHLTTNRGLVFQAETCHRHQDFSRITTFMVSCVVPGAECRIFYEEHHLGADWERPQLRLAIERCRRPLRLLLVVYRPSERLEDPTAGTGLGVAEDRVMAVAADRNRFSSVE